MLHSEPPPCAPQHGCAHQGAQRGGCPWGGSPGWGSLGESSGYKVLPQALLLLCRLIPGGLMCGRGLPQPPSCGAVPGAAVLGHGLGGERRAASLPPHPACATAGCCSAHRTRYRAHVSFACKEPHYSALINHDRLPFFSKIVQQLFKHTSNENFIAADLISCRPVVSEQVGVHPEPTQAATRLSCC